MTAHARFGASKAHRWMTCPGSLAAEDHYENTSSRFAEEGTRAHEVAAAILLGQEFAGRDVDSDMLDAVNVYCRAVQEQCEHGATLMVEQRVCYARFLGLNDDEAFGTADAIVVGRNEFQVHDLKYGRGVAVSAVENEQLMLYALGALAALELAQDISKLKSVRLFIHQPRLGVVDEWAVSLEDLLAFGEKAKAAAAAAKAANAPRVPNSDACRFCRAKADCPALAGFVLDTVSNQSAVEFGDLDAEDVRENIERTYSEALGAKMSAVALIEDWCRAVRARVESELFAGRSVAGFKLVEGRRGPRQWTDPESVETAMRVSGVSDELIFERKLISPTAADKLRKGNKISVELSEWLSTMVRQAEGKPSVAEADDKRPAFEPGDVEFEPMCETVE